MILKVEDALKSYRQALSDLQSESNFEPASQPLLPVGVVTNG